MYQDKSEQLQKDRQAREQMAHQLREEALKQGLMAVQGMFALPAVVAFSAASWAMYAVAFVERGFEAFQRTSEQMEKNWQGPERLDREREGTQPRA